MWHNDGAIVSTTGECTAVQLQYLPVGRQSYTLLRCTAVYQWHTDYYCCQTEAEAHCHKKAPGPARDTTCVQYLNSSTSWCADQSQTRLQSNGGEMRACVASALNLCGICCEHSRCPFWSGCAVVTEMGAGGDCGYSDSFEGMAYHRLEAPGHVPLLRE